MKGFAKGKEDEQAGEIDLTPMLDVVFILLIFFIVTSVFVKEAGYEINYPAASQVEGVDGEPVLIAISPVGEMWMDGDVIPPRNLRLRIEQRLAESPNAPVVVQADQNAPNEFVLMIMNAAREAEAPSVQIAAED